MANFGTGGENHSDECFLLPVLTVYLHPVSCPPARSRTNAITRNANASTRRLHFAARIHRGCAAAHARPPGSSRRRRSQRCVVVLSTRPKHAETRAAESGRCVLLGGTSQPGLGRSILRATGGVAPARSTAAYAVFRRRGPRRQVEGNSGHRLALPLRSNPQPVPGPTVRPSDPGSRDRRDLQPGGEPHWRISFRVRVRSERLSGARSSGMASDNGVSRW